MAHLDLRAHITPSAEFPDAKPNLYTRYGKRAVDLILAIGLVPLLTPIIALLCVLTRTDGAPGLFAHRRVGQHGQSFTCWKIRTMVRDAPALLEAHLRTNPAAAAEWARTQKLQNDPRITRLGRILRRTSLDELPQIWNVLRGEMSLVGPRPITAPELDRYGLHRHVYLGVKPGVTGLWQVTARDDGCYAQRLQLDQVYVQTMGLPQDLALMARTALVLVRPTGR